MLKFMKKIPGGLLLIPMLISAIFYTFLPNFFNVGTVSGTFFYKKGDKLYSRFDLFFVGNFS